MVTCLAAQNLKRPFHLSPNSKAAVRIGMGRLFTKSLLSALPKAQLPSQLFQARSPQRCMSSHSIFAKKQVKSPEYEADLKAIRDAMEQEYQFVRYLGVRANDVIHKLELLSKAVLGTDYPETQIDIDLKVRNPEPYSSVEELLQNREHLYKRIKEIQPLLEETERRIEALQTICKAKPFFHFCGHEAAKFPTEDHLKSWVKKYKDEPIYKVAKEDPNLDKITGVEKMKKLMIRLLRGLKQHQPLEESPAQKDGRRITQLARITSEMIEEIYKLTNEHYFEALHFEKEFDLIKPRGNSSDERTHLFKHHPVLHKRVPRLPPR